jgi:hypothetical protein
MIREETAKRTHIQLPLPEKRTASPVIVLALSSDRTLEGMAVPVPEQLPGHPEGYAVVLAGTAGKPVLWLIGNDRRGVLFAAGHFLRTAVLEKRKITLNPSCETVTWPEYPLRGHQLGYRHTANSYDAWTPAQYEQYIRELAVFGTNSIETTPFDRSVSPHIRMQSIDMERHISDVCRRYGLEYWVWTPAETDLSDPGNFAAEVEKQVAFYRSVPRLDGVFFPGGDPGENHPKYVMTFLKEIAAALQTCHPEAGIWISLQGFSDEQTDYFYRYLETEQPAWLRGVVSGPSSPPLSETRYRLPGQYLHRHYPDITHTVRCQYPVPQWDQAFALTLGREACNPEPFRYGEIHNTWAPFTDGFITYSDGCHDDLNKIVWSRRGWHTEEPVPSIVDEYVRFFFGTKPRSHVTQAILGLERNWQGPVETNGGIEMTFAFWQQLEAEYPGLRDNWRWQLLLLRACYDTYTARRKLYERQLERDALRLLADASATGVEHAMQRALAKVNEADVRRIAPELRDKIVRYCDDLFQSIGLQTSVEKYQARGPERGCILDFLDYPLNNRWWLSDEFEKIRQLSTEEEKLARLEMIRTWEHPGKGSYYDNISDISCSPHVLTVVDDACDVAWWDGGKSRRRLSTQLFQQAPELLYEHLDPEGRYLIRIAGYGDALLRVDGERISPVAYPKELETFKEFVIDRRHVRDGRIKVTFDLPEESHLNWRQQSKICDIWLLKQP